MLNAILSGRLANLSIRQVSVIMESNLASNLGPETVEIVFNDIPYHADSLSENAKANINLLKFVDQQIAQRNNELQVADSAKIIYTSVLKQELEQR